MSAAGGRAHALLPAVFCLALPGCQSTIQIPGSLDPNSPAIAVVEFRLPPNGPLATLPYDSYQFQWVGEWVSSDSETTDPSLQTDATQTITVPKDDIYLSRVATFPPLGSLRGGRWSIALLTSRSGSGRASCPAASRRRRRTTSCPTWRRRPARW